MEIGKKLNQKNIPLLKLNKSIMMIISDSNDFLGNDRAISTYENMR